MKKIIWQIAALALAASSLQSGERPGFEFSKVGGYRKTNVPIPWSKRILQWDKGAMQLWMNNEMVLGSQVTQNPTALGLDYPAGERIEHLFGGGPIIGGIINCHRRFSAAY